MWVYRVLSLGRPNALRGPAGTPPRNRFAMGTAPDIGRPLGPGNRGRRFVGGDNNTPTSDKSQLRININNPAIIDFGSLDGPGGPRNHSKRWGAKCPAFWSGFRGPPSRAAQTPQIDDFWAQGKISFRAYINTKLGVPVCFVWAPRCIRRSRPEPCFEALSRRHGPRHRSATRPRATRGRRFIGGDNITNFVVV